MRYRVVKKKGGEERERIREKKLSRAVVRKTKILKDERAAGIGGYKKF